MPRSKSLLYTLNRRIRSNLPVTKAKLENQEISSDVQNKKKELKERQKSNYDKSTAPLSKLKKGATVRLQNMEKSTTNKSPWPLKGVVIKVLPNRSYLVRTENGDVLRRNRRHLLETTEPGQQDEWYDAEEDLPALPAADQEDLPALPAADQQGPAPPEPELAARNDPPPLRRSNRVPKPNPKYNSQTFQKY